MARRNAPKTVNLKAGPTLHIDDELLSEALAAVESRNNPTPAPSTLRDDEARSDIAVDIAEHDQEDALGVITIQTLSDDLVMELEPVEPRRASADIESASMFEIPADLLAPDATGGAAPKDMDPEDERTDPSGIKPRTSPQRLAKPITADPKMLDRVSRMRKRIRKLQRRKDELKAELDRERQAHQLSRSRFRITDNARQEAEEQRDNIDRFARSLRSRLQGEEEEISRLQRRSSHEIEQTRMFAADSTIREILPVLDNLLLALGHADTDLGKFLPGVQMVSDQFQRSLERLGVGFIEASVGTPFDPAVHEAILTMPSTELLAGTIAEEVRSGYTLNGRLLRASQVTVAGPPRKAPERSVPPEADDARPPSKLGAEE